MTDHAAAGTPHNRLPPGVGPDTVRNAPTVVPWLCPHCERPVAETVFSAEVDRVSGQWRLAATTPTVPVEFSPVRYPDADDGEVPFFGPSKRAWKDKGERRSMKRLRDNAYNRWRQRDERLADPGGTSEDPRRWMPDHNPIMVPVFDTLCWPCEKRIRIEIARAGVAIAVAPDL